MDLRSGSPEWISALPHFKPPPVGQLLPRNSILGSPSPPQPEVNRPGRNLASSVDEDLSKGSLPPLIRHLGVNCPSPRDL